LSLDPAGNTFSDSRLGHAISELADSLARFDRAKSTYERLGIGETRVDRYANELRIAFERFYRLSESVDKIRRNSLPYV